MTDLTVRVPCRPPDRDPPDCCFAARPAAGCRRTQQRDSRIVGIGDPDTDVQKTAELYWAAAASGLEDLFTRIDLGPALERGLRAMQTEYRSPGRTGLTEAAYEAVVQVFREHLPLLPAWHNFEAQMLRQADAAGP